PLETFLRDPEVTEIMVNNWDTIYVERGGKIYWTGAKFFDENQLRRTIDKIVARIGRRIDEASPYVDARLPDGSRVNAIIPPLAISSGTPCGCARIASWWVRSAAARPSTCCRP